MGHPLSVAASIAGIISLPDVVATKGYRYITEVRNCRKDVGRLIIEAQMLYEVLKGLQEASGRLSGSDSLQEEGTFCSFIS